MLTFKYPRQLSNTRVLRISLPLFFWSPCTEHCVVQPDPFKWLLE